MRIPKKIKFVGFVSGVQLCHERKMTASMNNFFFAKREWLGKAQNILYNI
jgi:hypothetical protein